MARSEYAFRNPRGDRAATCVTGAEKEYVAHSISIRLTIIKRLSASASGKSRRQSRLLTAQCHYPRIQRLKLFCLPQAHFQYSRYSSAIAL